VYAKYLSDFIKPKKYMGYFLNK